MQAEPGEGEVGPVGRVDVGRLLPAAAGLRQLVYLGGLGSDDDPDLSPHLASRHEVGRVLAAGPVPVTELRAAIIIGSGSASLSYIL